MVRRAPHQVSGNLTILRRRFLPEDLTFAPLILSLLRRTEVRIPLPPAASRANSLIGAAGRSFCYGQLNES